MFEVRKPKKGDYVIIDWNGQVVLQTQEGRMAPPGICESLCFPSTEFANQWMDHSTLYKTDLCIVAQIV
jgi:hypothetical protein